MSQPPEVVHYASPAESDRRKQFAQLVRTNPIPDTELLDNLGVFLNGKTVARLKFMDFIYEQIVEVPGVVMEFGTRWGQNLSHWAALRGIYEPFNRHRKLIGFDTFAGFAGVSEEDGKSKMMTPGNYAVTPGYEQYLQQVLEYR